MSKRHDAWRDLVLSYEDLSEEERAQADLHLADCESCRVLLVRIRDLMSTPGPRGEIPPLDDASLEIGRLSASDRAAAAESLAALRRRLGLVEQTAALHPPRSRGLMGTIRRIGTDLAAGGLRWRVLVPAAAVAVVALLLVSRWTGEEPIEIRELRIVPASRMRGIDQREEAEPPKRAWRNGDAFRIRFELTRSGNPVLLHVDPVGVVRRIYPEDPRDVLAPQSAGEPVELPPADSAIEWLFEGQPGLETFILVVAEREGPSVSEIDAQIAALAGEVDNRASLLRSVTRSLEGRGAAVRSIEVDHLP